MTVLQGCSGRLEGEGGGTVCGNYMLTVAQEDPSLLNFSIEGHFVQPHVAILFTLSDFWRHFTKIRIKIMVLTGLPE